MPGSQKTDQDAFHDIVLSDDHFRNLAPNFGETLHGQLKVCLRSHVFIVEQRVRADPYCKDECSRGMEYSTR
jgi:hypothetical protein